MALCYKCKNSSCNCEKQKQSDWKQTDLSKADYILNKPKFKTINGNSIVGTGDIVVGGGGIIEIPTASEEELGGIKIDSPFYMDGDFLKIDLSDYYTKVEIDGLISSPYVLPTASPYELGGIKLGIGLSITGDGVVSAGFDNELFIVVLSLPIIGISNKIYLVPLGSPNPNDVYEEWIYIENQWEKLGETSMDLSNYYTKSEVDDLILNSSTFYNSDGNLTSNRTINGNSKGLIFKSLHNYEIKLNGDITYLDMFTGYLSLFSNGTLLNLSNENIKLGYYDSLNSLNKYANLKFNLLSEERNYNFPNKSGIFALLSDLSNIYSTNGALSSDRTVSGNFKNLNFINLSRINFTDKSDLELDSGSSFSLNFNGTDKLSTARLRTTNLTNPRIFEFPDKAGTFALLDDIKNIYNEDGIFEGNRFINGNSKSFTIFGASNITLNASNSFSIKLK